MAPGRIIYLNGTSSAGKSSIAAALQEILAEPYLHIDAVDQTHQADVTGLARRVAALYLAGLGPDANASKESRTNKLINWKLRAGQSRNSSRHGRPLVRSGSAPALRP